MDSIANSQGCERRCDFFTNPAFFLVIKAIKESAYSFYEYGDIDQAKEMCQRALTRLQSEEDAVKNNKSLQKLSIDLQKLLQKIEQGIESPDKPKTDEGQPEAILSNIRLRYRIMLGGIIAGKNLDEWRKETELDPENPTNWKNLGYLLIESGETKEAGKAFCKALELAETANDKKMMTIAINYLAEIYDDLGDQNKVKEMREKMRALTS